MKVALLLVGGVVVGLVGLFLYLLRFHTYLGDDPSACVNCHIMTPYYATWMHGAHARNTTCNDCHVPHDNVFRKYYFKGKDGMNHVYKFVTRQERQAIRAIDESAEVIMENCVRCHATLNTELVNTGRITYMDAKCGAGQACWDCHRDVAHGKMNSLSIIRKTKRAEHRKRSVHPHTPLRRNEALHFRGIYQGRSATIRTPFLHQSNRVGSSSLT